MAICIALLACGNVVRAMTCNKEVGRGPFELEQEKLEIGTAMKKVLRLQRISVEKNVELAIGHRSFWSSFCYNGGSLDPNTGCYNGII